MDVTSILAEDLFVGQAVFVTGGGSGINLGIARTFAALGANLAICGRTQERLDAAAVQLRALGAQVVTSVADVRDPDALKAAFAASLHELGPANVVIAGAAGNFVAPVAGMRTNGFRSVVDIDLVGSFNTARAAHAQLKETGGSLLFLSGGQSYHPYVQQAHVGAAKAGIDSLMRTLALEWGPEGIRVNSLVPGPIEGTEGMRRLADAVGEETWRASTALGRFGRLEEIGAMAAVLASPLGSYVTGARLDVDGGLALSGPGLVNRAVAAAAATEA